MPGMSGTLTSAVIVIASLVTYQVCMKLVPGGVNPISALATFYFTALICTLAAARFVPTATPLWSASEFSWAAVFVGVAIVGIELGYLLMYRSGWNLSTAPVIGMGSAAVILVPISVMAFKQPWTPRYLVGIALCIYGLYLLTPRAQ